MRAPAFTEYIVVLDYRYMMLYREAATIVNERRRADFELLRIDIGKKNVSDRTGVLPNDPHRVGQFAAPVASMKC